MLLLAAAVVAAATPQGVPNVSSGPVVQARATVRIISGVRLRLGEATSPGAPPARDSMVRTEGGAQPAKLIEFQ